MIKQDSTEINEDEILNSEVEEQFLEVHRPKEGSWDWAEEEFSVVSMSP